MMKKTTINIFLALGLLLLLTPSMAQRNLALYSMPGVQQATYVNPSFIPDADIVIGLPVISNINAGFFSTGFNLRDLGMQGYSPRGISLDYNAMLRSIEMENTAGGELSTSLFSVGFRTKNDYIAFEASEHVSANAYYPRDAIQFGADLKNSVFQSGLAYNLMDLTYDLTHYRNFSALYARQFGRASAGVRVRYLVGLENYSTSGPGIVLSPSEEADVYQVAGQLQLWSAGASSLSGDGPYPAWGQGNRGFAFDFGSTYALGEKLKASFSVINLGGINWTSDVRRRTITNVIDNPTEEVEDIFNGFITGKPAQQLSYNTALPTLIFVGGTYELNEKSAFNLLANSRYAQGRHNLGAALSYYREFGDNVRASLTYSAVQGSLADFGASMAIKLGPVELFGAVDNLVTFASPSTTNTPHINLGINLVFDKKPKTEVPVAAVPPVDTASLDAGPVPPGYTLIQGGIYLDGQSEKVDHYFLTVRKVLPEGRREVVRSGRNPGGDYRLYLEQSNDYEVRIEYAGAEPLLFKLKGEDMKRAKQNISKNITLNRLPTDNLASEPSKKNTTTTTTPAPAPAKPKQPAAKPSSVDTVKVQPPQPRPAAPATTQPAQPERPADKPAAPAAKAPEKLADKPATPVEKAPETPATKPQAPAPKPSPPAVTAPEQPADKPAAPAATAPEKLVDKPAAPAGKAPETLAAEPQAPAPKPSPPAATAPAQPPSKPAAPPAPEPEQLAAEPAAPPPAQPEVPAEKPAAPARVKFGQLEVPPAAAQDNQAPGKATQYAVFQGAIRLEGESEKVSHYYFDVYRIMADGQRELERTGRMPGGDFKLYLNRDYKHEVSIRHSDSAPLLIDIEKKDLANTGPTITRNLILRKAAPAGGRTGNLYQKKSPEPSTSPEPAAEDLMGLSVSELQQEESEAIQRPVPKEEPLDLWTGGQQDRSVKLKKDISIYKEMDAGSRVLARLSMGAEVEVLERTTSEWWMVAYRSRIGWVQARELK